MRSLLPLLGIVSRELLPEQPLTECAGITRSVIRYQILLTRRTVNTLTDSGRYGLEPQLLCQFSCGVRIVFEVTLSADLGEVTFASAILLGVIATFGACGASGVAGGSLLLIPMACSFFGIGNDVAMQAVAVGFIIGVVQDSVETALNSSGDVFFTATAEEIDRKGKGE